MKLIFIAILLLTKIQLGLGALEKIECRYYEHVSEGYVCELHITNPNAWDNFTTITGTHVGSYQDSDVMTIRRHPASYTTNIPSIICNTFRNLINFYYGRDFIRQIEDFSFSGCMSLRNIILSNSRIERISQNAFRNNFALEWIHMDNNFITDFPRNLFVPATLRLLNMDRNHLQVIHADSFGQQPRFGFLRVNNNLIRGFDERLVGNSNLWDIQIKGNICADADINDQSPNREILRSVLQNCFDSYRDRLD